MKKLFLLLFLLLSRPCWAAVGYDNTDAIFGQGVSSVTIVNYAVTGSNTLMLCGVGIFAGSGVGPDVTFNSVNVPLLDAANPYGVYTVSIYGLAGVSGTHDAVATFTDAANMVLGCTTLTGVNQGTPVGATSEGNWTSETISVTVPTDGMGWDFSTAINAFDCSSGTTPGAGQTSRLAECSNFSVTDFEIMVYMSTRATTGNFDWDDPVCCPVTYTFAIPVNPAIATGAAARTRRYFIE